MSISERIIQIQKAEGYTASQFAEKLGVQRSGLSHIYSGRNNPSIDFIQKLIKNFTKYNAEWILSGIEPMLRHDRDEEKPTQHDQKEQNIQAELFNEVKSEPEAIYHKRNRTIKTEEPDKSRISDSDMVTTHLKRIILIYDDDTFEVIHSKKAK